MGKTIASLIVMVAWIIVSAPAQAQWANEPSGSQVVMDCNFSGTPGACGLLDVYTSAQSGTDATAPVSPSGAMVGVLPAYSPTGGAQIVYYVPGAPVREIFVGMSWRTNSQFQGRTVPNKIFFIRGPYLGNGVFVMQAPSGSPQMPIFWVHNTSGISNQHVCPTGDGIGLNCYANVGNSNVTMGVWYKLEVYQKASTTATSRDGIVRWWINGNLVGNYTNINYAPNGFDQWQLNHTWDGAGDMGTINTVQWEHWLDHLHISVPNGSVSNPDNPPGPPSTPTLRGLSVP